MEDENSGMRSAQIYLDGNKSRYVIYEDGTVINITTSHIMRHMIKKAKRGRRHIVVRLTNNKKRKEYLLSRLLAKAFIPNPENKEYVHHIDRNPLNNDLDNLMWVTMEEHITIHAQDENHLYAGGEKAANAILTETQVREICELIANNTMSQPQIAKRYGVPTYIIREIRLKHNWSFITKDYDFSEYTAGLIPMKEKDVHKVCKLISENYGSFSEIARKVHVTYDAVRRIYNHQNYTNISKDYDFSKFTKILRYSSEIHTKVEELMKEGKSNTEIVKLLNLPKSAATNTFMYRKRKEYNKQLKNI